MNRMCRRSMLIPALCALVVGVFAGPSAALAKTFRLNVLTKGTLTGDKIHGTADGKPVGHCTYTGKLVIPTSYVTWKCKGGTLKFKASTTSGASNDVKGPWKIVGGTGKFKHAKGHGTQSGKLSTGVFRYIGKISY